MMCKQVVAAIACAHLTIVTAAAAGDSDAVPSDSHASARQAYYGDLLVMSGSSVTGYFRDIRVTPNDAYRFARGEAVMVEGQSIRRKSAPLDFLAVTDISEDLGLFNTLYDPNSPFSKTEIGKEIRDPATRAQAFGKVVGMTYLGRGRGGVSFGLPPEVIEAVTNSAWREEVDAANRNYLPGTFTTFIAYHWTSKVGGNLDRVVLFGGDRAPTPFTAIDSVKPEDLWAYLEESRKQGYEVMAIPHEPNHSNGLMFNGFDSAGRPIDRVYAERRATNEPVVEIAGVGQSETHPELSPNDEFSAFELLGQEMMEKPAGSYVRDALGRGLEIANRSGGINPYKVGFVGGGHFHNGLSDSAEDFSVGLPDAVNPAKPISAGDAAAALKSPVASGSLTGVWAEENTRESIFTALRRKETFATSGTRLKLRLFAGWDYDENLLKEQDWVKVAYARGVSMGADLPAKPNGSSAPRLIVWAAKDPAGANLDRLQLIKVSLGKQGKYVEKIYDVVLSNGREGDSRTGKAPAVGSTVDMRTASYANTIGAPELATVWRDPEFDPEVPAVYYLRVLEIPTPRWSTIVALKSGIRVADLPSKIIQERAWSSPIWFAP